MRIILAIFIMALCQAVAVADNKSPNPQPGIEETIRLQIEAFKKDDAQTAFSLATPFIQRRYGTPDTFMAVVAFAYPQVYRPQSYRFTERVDRTSHTLQKVIIVGPKNATVAAIYEMVQIEGKWRINGCYLAALPGQDI